MIKSGPTIRFCAITDVHFNLDVVREHWTIFDNQWREYSTAEDRLTAAIATANSTGCDLFIQLGDICDVGQQVASWETELDLALDTMDDFEGEGVINVLGNHEANFAITKEGYEISDYWTAVDNSHNQVTRANEHYEDGNLLCYTYDYGGFRFVSLFTDLYAFPTERLEWLYKGDDSGVLETELPCIVLTHCIIYENPETDNYGYDLVSFSKSTAALIRSTFEAAGNVRLVMSGHFHKNTINENALVEVVNGIVYLALRGSILGLNDGDSQPGTVEDSAHYVVEIDANNIESQLNLRVIGYKKGTSQDVQVPFVSYYLG